MFVDKTQMRFLFLYYDKEDDDLDNSDGQRKKNYMILN